MRKIKKEEQKDFLEKIQEIQSKYQDKNKFDKIYLLLLHTVYVIEIEKNRISKKEFTKKQQYEYSEKAKESMDNYKI